METSERVASIRSNQFAHIDGYDWRIICTDRWKNHYNSFAVHFASRPTREEFEELFMLFLKKTHHVHVNLWVDGEWKTFTEEYTRRPFMKRQPSQGADTWPDGKTHRVKYWDEGEGAYNFAYFDRKPAGIVLSRYHTATHFAVVEARPEGV